jgi:hypothetical protein
MGPIPADPVDRDCRSGQTRGAQNCCSAFTTLVTMPIKRRVMCNSLTDVDFFGCGCGGTTCSRHRWLRLHKQELAYECD